MTFISIEGITVRRAQNPNVLLETDKSTGLVLVIDQCRHLAISWPLCHSV